ncbi:hypothetical protein BH09MYX1_BH09MYX1_21180 [soil metagenome]
MAFGIDAVQAVEQSIQGIRFVMETRAPRPFFFCGVEGYAGISRHVPEGYGEEMEAAIERVLQARIDRKGRPPEP